jgi:lipoprotein-releasing system permease protein
MGYPLMLAARYLGGRKRQSISVGTAFAVLGVALGVAALLTVMSVTGGFQEQFRDKVLGVNAHVLVLKPPTGFRRWRVIMEKIRVVEGVRNVAPFNIRPMMLSRGRATATGVLLKGVDPKASLGVGLEEGVPAVLDLPRHILRGEKGECATDDTRCGVEQLRGLRTEAMAKHLLAEEARRGYAPQLPAVPSVSGSESASPPPSPSAAPSASASPSASAAPGELPPELRQELERRIREIEEQNGLGEGREVAPGGQPAVAVGAEPPSAAPLPSGAPVGDVTPEGGYASVLPDDDDLPADLVKDPCDDPEAVKQMPGLVVGKTLARTLDVDLGGCVTITSPTIGFMQMADGALRAPIAKRFRVLAIFEAGFEQYDAKLAYTDLFELVEFYGDEEDAIVGIEAKIEDIDASEEVLARVKDALGSPAYQYMDWKELNRGLFTALLIQKVGMSAVLALIILVAAFTVVATLIMVVLDKKKEISVLKAMGATDGAILRVFLYQGALIGTLGTSLGLLLGYGVCKGLLVYAFPLDPKVYFISHLPVLIRPFEFVVTGAIAITLCLAATVVPSLYAAHIRPAEGFRDT